MSQSLSSAMPVGPRASLVRPDPTELVGQPWALAAVQQRALSAGRPVLAAQRAVGAAQADGLTAQVTPAAQLSWNTTAINPHNMGQGGVWSRPFDTVVRLDKTLERGDKAELRGRVAQAAEAAAREDLGDATRLQRRTATQAYWQLKLAQAQWQTADRSARLAQESNRLAQLRLSQGDVSRLEATRLAVEAERAHNDEALASAQLEQARLALRQVLALEQDADSARIVAADPWPAVPEAVSALSADAEAAWLAERTDVKAARQRVTQAEAALQLAQAQREADVTVGVQYEHYPPDGRQMWGLGLSVPLGMAGRQDGPVRRAAIAVDDARAELERVQSAALAERAGVRAALVNAASRVQRLRDLIVPQAEEAWRAAEYARQQGALGLQDVLDARRILHAAEMDLASAQADLAVALAARDDLGAAR